jgi:long-subunit acyl-CoA synthetase (AMP-forming)
MEKLPSISQISQGYGMTEASMATHLPLFGFKNPSAVGKLISNMEMKVYSIYIIGSRLLL